jgi:hypothetical protein
MSGVIKIQTALDTSHCASRRLGFSAIPLCAVLVRVVWQILWQLPLAYHLQTLSSLLVLLFIAKCILGVLLVWLANWKIASQSQQVRWQTTRCKFLDHVDFLRFRFVFRLLFPK